MARIDGKAKVTGRALYADDLYLDRMLHARPVHAEHAHAEILSIDTAPALTVPGVVDVLTAAGVPGMNRVGGILKDHYVFAADKTRYVGDVVALVAAESPAAARAGARAVRVEVRPLEPLLDPERAAAPDAPRVHPERKDNVFWTCHVRQGDPAAEFSRCDVVLEREWRTQYVEHSYLEPEACVAVPEPDGSVSVLGGMQHPFTARRFVSWATGLPLAAVRIVQTTLGGGFGGKDDTISVVCARAAILALRTRRPVKLVYTREESIRESYKRHPFLVRHKLGLGQDGKLRALDARLLADGGPYCSTTPFVIWRPTVQCTGPYLVPHVFGESRGVYTNGPLTGAMRGFGSPQINFAIESLMDDAAHAVGLDPVEFRRRNFFTQGCTTHTGQKLDNHVVAARQVLDLAVERSGWTAKWTQCSRGTPDAEGKLHGIGLACSYRGVSLGAEGLDFCSAIVNVQPDASVTLEVGVAENGQGLQTAMATILAGELGLPLEKIRYLDVDTSRVPDGGPTVASRGTLVGGNAVVEAARRIREAMAEALGSPGGPFARDGRPPNLVFRDGSVADESSGREMLWGEAVAACHERRVHLHAMGTWRGPQVSWDEEHGRGDAYFTYVYGCNVAEVTVDAKSGEIAVRSLLGVHDVGKAVFEEGVRGQILGGMVMGLGFALHEELLVDEAGRIASLNFDRYRIPKATAIPKLEWAVVENADAAGPWGAKSLGEPVNELAAAAIGNALFHATGIRVSRLPIRGGDFAQSSQRTQRTQREEKAGVASGPPSPASGNPRRGRVELRVNGKVYPVEVAEDTTLLDVLRDELRLTGTKCGCGIGQCGTCTVLLDGRVRRACTVDAVKVGKAEVTTIEGLTGPGGSLHPLQRAFLDAGAVQCGFCTPGMILAAKALLDRNPRPSRDEIRRALAGNLCRCTGYEPIFEAIERAGRGAA
ncbi:MAG: molybdopterin-dependent oxidoreductase [Deltaproteobacteria bacterium]|nr:molybdopterin-dependent oxidoreductase [Deltaproteobacteria bacterium]